MRIISGKFKGQQIKAPGTSKTRPTLGRNRELLFNLLGQYFDGGSFLDAFAGTGAVAIEAYSRGAEFIELIEKSGRSINIIRENLEKLDISQYDYNLIKADFWVYYLKIERKFDYIFLDPPYAQLLETKLIDFLNFSHNILEKKGTIILEHTTKFNFNWEQYKNLYQILHRNERGTAFTIMELKE